MRSTREINRIILAGFVLGLADVAAETEGLAKGQPALDREAMLNH
jgi:hypothetical protein